jgi:uncharacterized protein
MKKVLPLVFALMLVGASCNKPEEPVVLQSLHYADGFIKIAGREVSLELADQPDEQSLGLGGRDSIEENQGMLFPMPVPTLPVFWMKGMLMPIDIVWIKGDEVVDITAEAQPQPGVSDAKLKTYSPKKPADWVLELKAGWAARNGLKIGDKIELTEVIR